MPALTYLVIAALLFAARPSDAHVVVEPDRTLSGGLQVYTVIVPAEHPVSPTVEVTLLVPLTFDILSVEESPGWQFTMLRDMRGGVSRLTWSGGRVTPHRFLRFAFAAQNPDVPTTVIWFATQRYADGSVDEWNDPESEERTASVTHVVLPEPQSGANRTAVAIATAAFVAALLALAIAMIASRRRTPPPATA